MHLSLHLMDTPPPNPTKYPNPIPIKPSSPTTIQHPSHSPSPNPILPPFIGFPERKNVSHPTLEGTKNQYQYGKNIKYSNNRDDVRGNRYIMGPTQNSFYPSVARDRLKLKPKILKKELNKKRLPFRYVFHVYGYIC